jgi:dTDP-glucose pyrophosphorylase
MTDFIKHILSDRSSVIDALKRLNELAIDAIIFIVNEKAEFIGSLTDGDIRRGFIRGLGVESSLTEFIHSNPHFIFKEDICDIDMIISLREMGIKIVPILDKNRHIIDIINFRRTKSVLPVTSVLMAGGRGERLGHLTIKTPKPMLKIGEKQIIEYNVENLINHGIKEIYVMVNYLADQVINHFINRECDGVNFHCVKETEYLGTIGSVSLMKEFSHDSILVMNSDIFTNIDFEDFYLHFRNSNADISVASIPYSISVPYAVLDIYEDKITGFKEKPSYTFYSNAGIYLIKKEILDFIPKNQKFDATDLIQKIIDANRNVTYFPIVGYWIDIGRPEDYKKAQEFVRFIKP